LRWLTRMSPASDKVADRGAYCASKRPDKCCCVLMWSQEWGSRREARELHLRRAMAIDLWTDRAGLSPVHVTMMSNGGARSNALARGALSAHLEPALASKVTAFTLGVRFRSVREAVARDLRRTHGTGQHEGNNALQMRTVACDLRAIRANV